MIRSLLLFYLLLLPCKAAAPPNKIYVTNYVYSYFNQTNWIYNNTVTTQTNYVFTTNNIHTTNTVYNILTVTNVMCVTNTWEPPPANLTLTNLSVVGWLSFSNSTPGLIQTFKDTNLTGHLP